MNGPEISADLIHRLNRDAPICSYCGKRSKFFLSSAHIYNGRDFGPVYSCVHGCDAYCGAHRDTLLTMGRLANKELRNLKILAHQAFDPLWRDLSEAYPGMSVFPNKLHRIARTRAYAWLSDVTLIPPERCHIGAFTPDECIKVCAVIESYKPNAAMIRAWAKSKQPTKENT